MTKHTPGPLSVSFGTKWPFDILIVNQAGDVVHRELLPCHSSKDQNFEEALNCRNFKASEQEEYAAINHRAVADAYLRAAAPDLLEVLQAIELAMRFPTVTADAVLDENSPIREGIRAAIARATGEQP